MKSQFKTLMAGYLIIGLGSFSWALEIKDPFSDKKLPITDCIDKNLKFRIKCSPQWPLEVMPRSISLLIDQTPDKMVSLNISQSEETDLNLKDLTPHALQYVYEYADNFKIANARVNNQKALRVVAHSAKYKDIKLIDYFLAKEGRVYRLSFAVNTQADLEKYSDLFEQLVKSFEFYNFQEYLLSLTNTAPPVTK